MSIARVSVDCSSVTAFPGTAQCIFEFTPKETQVVNLHSSESVDVSFDGVTVHYKLTPGTLSAGVVLQQRATKLWFRRSSASGSPTGVLIQIVAER